MWHFENCLNLPTEWENEQYLVMPMTSMKTCWTEELGINSQAQNAKTHKTNEKAIYSAALQFAIHECSITSI